MTRRKLEKTILMHGGNISLATSIIVLVAFAVGLLVGTLVIAKVYGVNNMSGTILPMAGSFADGWNAAKLKLSAANPMMSNASSLSGQIKEIKGKEIIFTAGLLNPLDDESLKTRIAVIDDKTKITVWKLKSAEQAEKDREEAQASLASLQKDNASLNEELNACNQKMMAGGATESDACKAAREAQIKNMQAMSDAQRKMDMYQKIENGNLSDIKSGWSITATGQSIEKAGDNNPSPMMGQYENISAKAKFTAGSIDVREVSAPPAMPPVPAVQ